MNFSLGIAIGYFENDDIFNGRKYLEVFFEENKNKKISQKDYENYKTILKKVFFEKLYTYINNKDYEKSTLILDCITAFVDEKEYNTSNFWATAGNCFKEFNSLDCAIDCMKKATEFQDFNPDIFRQIGDIYYFDNKDKINAISYYEKQGLIRVRKGNNGYREYSKEDIALLNEISLYRKLDIAIKDIK